MFGLNGPAALEDLVDGPDDPLGLEVEAPDVDAIARRRVASLQGPGDDSAAAAAYWRELAAWEDWGEWAPPIKPVSPERLEQLDERGWLR